MLCIIREVCEEMMVVLLAELWPESGPHDSQPLTSAAQHVAGQEVGQASVKQKTWEGCLADEIGRRSYTAWGIREGVLLGIIDFNHIKTPNSKYFPYYSFSFLSLLLSK